MKTGLILFDTKDRALKEVTSSNGETVRIYCCGPTVYRDAHVGNLRTFLLGDLITRTLNFTGTKTVLVQNITDVGHMGEDFDGGETDEDKILAQSKAEAKDPFEIAREYERRFHEDLALLNILPADNYPRASETIPLMLELIADLIKSGHAYPGDDGSVYFAAQSFPSYGAISGNRLDALKPGHRYEYVDDGAKRFHADWALWKAAGGRTEMVWPSPWGPGFPGWHIECSAMSLHFLNGHVDLHLGGIDLRFPHHENERAQSNSGAHAEVVDQWVHGEHLLFEGRKMSKSAGNVLLLKDIVQRGLDPLAARLCFLENRYRSQMDLTWESLEAASTTLQRWRAKVNTVNSDEVIDNDKISSEVESMVKDIQEDLDTPRALLKLRKIEKDASISSNTKSAIFSKIDQILGLDLARAPIAKRELTQELAALIESRAQARAAKDFSRSDELREKIRKLGVEVQDTPSGQTWEWC
jgi:cysteinyl-tRNA synthetase